MLRLADDVTIWAEDDGIVERPGAEPVVFPGEGRFLTELVALLRTPRPRELLAATFDEHLIDRLIDAGALVPWPLGDVLADIHRATLDGGGEAPDPSSETARILRDYDGAHIVDLPDPSPVDVPLGDALARRRSAGWFDGTPLPAEVLSTLLATAVRGTEASQGRRPYPSGGALYAVETLVHTLAVPGIEPAFYRYQPLGHRLARAAHPRPGPELARLLNDHPIEGSAIVVLLAADLARVSLGRYGGKAYRLLLLEAGHLAQNLLLVGTALGLAGLPICGLLDEQLASAAGLSFPHEVVVYAVAIGQGSPR